jgi:hypothetical protein
VNIGSIFRTVYYNVTVADVKHDQEPRVVSSPLYKSRARKGPQQTTTLLYTSNNASMDAATHRCSWRPPRCTVSSVCKEISAVCCT